ncbi:hypothetical protein [Vibrio harveyi]|uniref:hypothetical protein n=1 Tax=Vibrio harveyi TaxID=669 RepID=UPI003CF401C8
MEQYKLQVIELFKIFRRQYTVMSKALTDSDSAGLLLMWIKDLKQAGVPPEMITSVGDAVRKDPRFISFPPNSMQFISFYNEFYSSKDIEEEAEISQCEILIDRLIMRYSANLLFRNSCRDYWLSDLKSVAPSNFDAIECERTIREDVRFKQYPPNIDELMLIVKIQGSDLNFIPVSEAFDVAINDFSDSVDPYIKEARRRCGGRELRVLTLDVARKRFETYYEKVISDAIDGKFTGSASKKAPETAQTKEKPNPEFLISAIDKILAKSHG